MKTIQKSIGHRHTDMTALYWDAPVGTMLEVCLGRSSREISCSKAWGLANGKKGGKENG
jgi:hypothetical protein